jgi:uncharacterized protein (TIGR02246 family)
MSDEAQVQELLRGIATAWNAGDATAYGDLFTEDADYVTWFGAHSKGRKRIEDDHRFLFDGPLKGVKLSEGAEGDVRFLSPDVALVISSGGAAERQSVITLTAVREGERWRFASFQNTRKVDIPGAPN